MATDVVRLGVVSAAMSAEPRAAVRAAREAGFAGLQFDAVSPGLDLLELSGSGRREFRRILTSQDEQLVGLRADLGGKGFAPGSDVDRLIARLDLVMEAAAGLGSPLVCVDVGPLPAPPTIERPAPAIGALDAGLLILPEPQRREPEPAAKPVTPPDPHFVDQLNGAMAEIGRHADRYSVTLAFRSELSSFASLKEALKAADCQWFGVDFDPVSVLKDAWDLDEFFSQLGPLTRHVRGRDAVGGAGGRTKPAVLGQGSVQWESILANLNQADYRGWITIDPVDLLDRPSVARSGLKYVRSLTI